jgi:uncharacterized repeat protein (TIGR01451 family)
MIKLFSFLSVSLLGAAFALTPAMAQRVDNPTPNSVEAKLSVFHVGKSADGKEALSPTDKAMPGDTLEYQTVYQNHGQAPVKSLAATLPLPVGLAYIPGSARPANAQASVDGKTFAAMPLKVMVKTPSGKLEEQLVPYSDYRALRWSVGDLPVNGTATVSARASVNPLSGAVAAPAKGN